MQRTGLAAACLVMTMLAGGAVQAEPADAVKVVRQVWKKGGRNTAGVADITLSNGNPFAVKNIKLRCVFTTPSTGKVSEIQQTISGPLKAKTEQTFKKVSFGFVDTQSSEGSCEVRDATQG